MVIEDGTSHLETALLIRKSTLLELQGRCKKEPDGYRDDFLVHREHFLALLRVLSADNEGGAGAVTQLTALVNFLAQVSGVYKKDMKEFPEQILSFLEEKHQSVCSAIRVAFYRALILMRHRKLVEPFLLLSAALRLIVSRDKPFRRMLVKYFVADVKTLNNTRRDAGLNRKLQGKVFQILSNDQNSGRGEDTAAKRVIGLAIALFRSGAWADDRTVDAIALATKHPSSRILVAALKFFMGHDPDPPEGSDADEDENEKKKPVGLTREEMYSLSLGTTSSRRKKKKKMQRALKAAQKASEKEDGSGGRMDTGQSFSALKLITDPYELAENLLQRIGRSSEKFSTKVLILQVVARLVGVHKLILCGLYPILQRYCGSPHQREAATFLAVSIQATHDLIPPEVISPLLRAILNNFVYDKATPLAMALGLKTATSIINRCPLVATQALVQDIAAYAKYQDKGVRMAARTAISVVRDIDPKLLLKKDRGRGADVGKEINAYGQVTVMERVPGAELLDHDEALSDADLSEELSDGENEESDQPEPESEEDDHPEPQNEEDDHPELESEEDDESEPESEEKNMFNESAGDGIASGKSTCEDASLGNALAEDGQNSSAETEHGTPSNPDSLRSLRKRLAQQSSASKLEESRILTQEDFKRIREKQMELNLDTELSKHGLKSVNAREKIDFEKKVSAEDLKSGIPRKLTKEERLAKVMEGREGREFGRRKRKIGSAGLSDKEKIRKKSRTLPIAAIKQQRANRSRKKSNKSNPKNFKGKLRK